MIDYPAFIREFVSYRPLLLVRLLQLRTISWGQAAVGCRTHGGLLKQADKHETSKDSAIKKLHAACVTSTSHPS